jgi:putative membrane protein
MDAATHGCADAADMNRPQPAHLGLLAACLLVFLWSAIHPHDYFTWALETFPAMLGVPLLIGLYPRFRFTTLVYTLVLLHACILMVGGHYTYAEVPLFNWLRDDHLGLARNDFDRLGHFAQGFVPAMIAREVLLRRSPLKRGGWLIFTVMSFCMALSACYELLEWAVAEASGTQADAFLSIQGDVWDTQWDMLTAGIGASLSLLCMSRWQDRQLRQMAQG